MANTQVSNVWDEFARGLFAFYVTGPWNIGEFRRRLPAERQDDWAAAPLPGPDGPGVSTAGGSSLVIFSSSRRKEAAWKLISFLSEPETMQRFHALTGDLPPRRSAWRAPALADDLPSQAFARQLERVQRRSQDPRVGAYLPGDAAHRRTRRSGPAGAGSRLSRARRLGRCAAREAPLAAQQAGMTKYGAAAWILAGPALLVIAVFFALPVIAGLALSLTDFDIYALADLSTLRFVGLQNYARLLQTPLFWQALGNTLYFVVVGVPVSIGLSLCAALLLDSRFARWQPFFRTSLFAPVVTTAVAVAVIWRYLLHTRYGLVNQGLEAIGLAPVDWLGDPHWSMPAIIAFAAWKNFGYNMIILLAALQAVPRELYEAARIDGAGALRRFTDVTFPMLMPTFVLVGILTVSGYFQLFAEPYVMTQGGPLRSTFSMLYLMYEEGFRWWNLGNASAVAFLLFIVIFCASWVMLRFDRDAPGRR